jgi:uncharacterized protein (DUF2235 family)
LFSHLKQNYVLTKILGAWQCLSSILKKDYGLIFKAVCPLYFSKARIFMRRLIVCCDGTWQKVTSPYPTNVAKLVQAFEPAPENLVFYGEGVGTGNFLDRILGGIFGRGIDKNIQDAYRFLCLNYRPGDQIYLFGFSRGAFTVRSLVGLIRAVGILPPHGVRTIPLAYRAYQTAKQDYVENSEAERQGINLRDCDSLTKFRKSLRDKFQPDYSSREEADITFLGCWDTVGALGIPDQLPGLPFDQFFNRKYQFHNTRLSSKILHARHAVAIDENRKAFDYTRMEPAQNSAGQVLKPDQVKQVWFPGGHGCIGGGTAANSPLSNAALRWMMAEVTALNLGLTFKDGQIEDGLAIDPTIYFDNAVSFPFPSIKRDIPATTSPQNFHISVQQRWQACSWYRPPALAGFSFGPIPPHPINASEPSRALAVGETAQFVVWARQRSNPTGIAIQAQQTYRIEVSPLQVWQDAKIVCTAAGWQSLVVQDQISGKPAGRLQAREPQTISPFWGWFYQVTKIFSREPRANWLELVAEVGGQKYPVGLDCTFTATTTAPLIAYGNDVAMLYGNNKGWLFATITRLA